MRFVIFLLFCVTCLVAADITARVLHATPTPTADEYTDESDPALLELEHTGSKICGYKCVSGKWASNCGCFTARTPLLSYPTPTPVSFKIVAQGRPLLSVTAEGYVLVRCSNAPPQYRDAEHWTENGITYKCSENGIAGYIFFGDAIVGK